MELERINFEKSLLENEEVMKFGEDLLSNMMTASIRASMSGLGGCKKLDWNDFPEEQVPYLKRYLVERTGLRITYQAMKTKEKAYETREL